MSFWKNKRLLVLLLGGVLAVCVATLGRFALKNTSGGLPATVDYNLHVRPILSDKCFKCHGPDVNKREAGLRLDLEENAYAALKDNPQAHAIVPGSPEKSEVFLRIVSRDTAELMPPPSSRLALNDLEIKIIERWIKQGAKYKKHWAFIPPEQPALPKIKHSKWPVNEIDHFVVAKMEENGLAPNDPADRERLLKRVCFDLTGLPPTIEQQEQFLNDQGANAYEKMVDQLLASPHYGEKMALSWLDVARYADSHGYQDDGLRTMWPWRDWVIHAFNQNYSYEQFVTWQLAGDKLPNATKEMLLATGFNRNHKITQEGGVIDEEYRVEYVTDRTNTFGKAFLGLTFECAKCHDHKYDPIAQKDYFQAFAFFNQVDEKGLVGDISLMSLADPPKMRITAAEVRDVLRFINKKDTTSVEVMIMKDTVVPRQTYVLTRGNYDQHGEKVWAAMPASIFPYDTAQLGRDRLGLVKWMFSKGHPLTARVFVNRMWQEFFGRGLVKTAGDFGMQGELPTHPELLDWLALDFQNNGWDIKRLVRQLVLSATYRQSGHVSDNQLARDPENIWFSRAPRGRLPAEFVRDHILASSGLLVKEIGGPSVKPYQPKSLWESATSGRGQLSRYLQDHGRDLYRRGIYTFIKRTVPPPGMLTFDASNRDQCEVRRPRTGTPLQALILLNDPQVLEAARTFAERFTTANVPPAQAIEQAFRTIVCRKPKAQEVKTLVQYYEAEQTQFLQKPEQAELSLKIGEFPNANVPDKPATAALMRVITALYNLEETITR